jgi:hypothetical protein
VRYIFPIARRNGYTLVPEITRAEIFDLSSSIRYIVEKSGHPICVHVDLPSNLPKSPHSLRPERYGGKIGDLSNELHDSKIGISYLRFWNHMGNDPEWLIFFPP